MTPQPIPPRPRSDIPWLWIIILVLSTGMFLAWLSHEQQECEDRGGRYVRGLIWFECIGEGR